MKKIKNLAALTELSSSRVNEVYQIPLNEIESKRQVRVRFENIEELAESFRSEGQQTPITVTGPNSVGIYTILRGERRWQAAKLAGFETIDALISNKDQNKSDIVAGQLVENIQRENLTALEIAQSIQELSEARWSNRKIGQRLGKSESYVSMHLSLNKLPDKIKNLNYKGYVSDGSSLVTLRKMYELDAEKTLRIAEEIEENKGISRSQIRQYFAEMQAPKTEDPAEQAAPTLEDPTSESLLEPTTEQQTSLDSDDNIQHETSTENEDKGVSQNVLTTPVANATQKPSTMQAEEIDTFKGLEEFKIASDRFAIDVLVSEEDEAHIGQLLIGYVPTSKDRAWVVIEGTPMEVNISAITIVEVRDIKNEN